jgi:cell division protein FtsI/penicillin-binding protein 2
MTDTTSRFRLAQGIFVLAGVVLLARLAYWQIWKHEELSAVAHAQYERRQELVAERGSVLDRSGYVLVGNEEVYTLFAQPQVIAKTPAEIAVALAPLLVDQTATDSAQQRTLWQDMIQERLSGDRKWVALAHSLTREQKEAIEALQLHGLGFDTLLARTYPDASVAAHLLGFVGKDDQGTDQGYFGVEGYYDRELRGRPGKRELQRSVSGLPLLAAAEVRETSPTSGRTLRLTIDKALQQTIERELALGVERYGAESGEVIIMDTNTGAILAQAAVPSYDPRSFAEYDGQLYRNPAVSDLYEPGSTFKIFTVAAGVEAGVISPETTCPVCAGPREIKGFSIKTWNEVYNPNVTMRDALAKSDNTAMVYIQDLLTRQRTLEWWEKFGFDKKTNVDLQGEAQSPWREYSKWNDIDVATSTFGQGIAVTSVQMVRAASAIANGGKLVQPHVVDAVREGTEWQEFTLPEQERILSEETAKTVTQMMVNAAEQGDAKWTSSRLVSVAGKTGTAQIADSGKYLEDKTLASFIGFAPAENPQFVMLVRLRAPTTSPWGSETAAPLWYRLLPAVLQTAQAPEITP